MMMQILEQNIRYFTEESKALFSLSVSFGDAGCSHTLRSGLARENAPVTKDTLYDLASVSKLFLCAALMALRQAGRLRLDAPACEYAREFPHLGKITVSQLMGFQFLLTTPRRIDQCNRRQEGLDALFSASPAPLSGSRVYSDIPAMILKYVAQGAAQMPYWEILKSCVLSPLSMNHTYASVPDSSLCADYSGEHRLECGRLILRDGPKPGVPHDPKASLLSPHGEDLCGHAGIFSTEGDMIRFCQGILSRKILSDASLREIAINRTGMLLPSGEYRQYLGYLCYLKHPRQYDSEIPPHMGDSAFGIGGFTGNHLSIDPEKGIFTLFLGNRCHNRLSVLRPEPGKTWTDYGLNPDGTGQYAGVYSSVDYVHKKDALLHTPIGNILLS